MATMEPLNLGFAASFCAANSHLLVVVAMVRFLSIVIS